LAVPVSALLMINNTFANWRTKAAQSFLLPPAATTSGAAAA
jgi:hypothetical protein